MMFYLLTHGYGCSARLLHQLVEGLGLSGLPFKRVHLWPKKFEGCVGGGVGGELPAHSVAYFVGLEVDPRRGKEGAVLDVDKVRDGFLRVLWTHLCCSRVREVRRSGSIFSVFAHAFYVAPTGL